MVIMLELDKIYNMDCIEGMKQIDDNSIDLILTDPPYNIKKDDWDKINNFDLWLENWMQLCFDKLKKNELYNKHLQELHEKGSKKKRRRRRGPRVLVAEPTD